MNRRRLLIILIIITLLSLIAAIVFFKQPVKAPNPVATVSPSTAAKPQVKSQANAQVAPPATPAFNKQQYSINDPSSPWVVANKLRQLNPTNYAPDVAAPNMQLRLSSSAQEMQVSKQAIVNLEQLNTAAKAAGLQLMLASSYRSYNTQASVYGNEVRNYGQAQADRQSARPGHSEHQTGLAIDLAPASGQCLIQECFGTMAEGKWLAAHAHEFGFIIRYPQGKEAITGYIYEPWHLRYVGLALSTELAKQGNPTLEEFFGLPAAPNY